MTHLFEIYAETDPDWKRRLSMASVGIPTAPSMGWPLRIRSSQNVLPKAPSRKLLLPQEVVLQVEAFLRPHGTSMQTLLSWIEFHVKRSGGYWAIVFFPRELPVGGHVASLRGDIRNVLMLPYRYKSFDQSSQEGMGGVMLIRSKEILRQLSGRSPLFKPLWQQLHGCSWRKHWGCIAHEPDPDGLRRMGLNNQAVLMQYKGLRTHKIQVPSRPLQAVIDLNVHIMADGFHHGNTTSAIAACKRIIRHLPENHHLWTDLATLYSRMNGVKARRKAMAAAGKALALCPTAIKAHEVMAVCARQEYNADAYMRACERILALDPFRADILWDRYESGLVGELSPSEWSRLARLAPTSEQIWHRRGLILTTRGRWISAARAFAIAVVMNPEAPWALNCYAYCCAKTGRLQQALEAAELAVQLDPNAADARDTRGCIYYLLGRTEDAATEFSAARQLNANHFEAIYHLGLACLKLGRWDQALAISEDLSTKNASFHEELEAVIMEGQPEQLFFSR